MRVTRIRAAIAPLFTAAVLMLHPGFAAASLIPTQPNETSGTGLGAVNTVLTMQNDGGSTTESGCVAYNGTTVITGPAACPPGIEGGDEVGVNQTPRIGDVGLNSAYNLRVVFNASEDVMRTIRLENAVLRIFSPAGTVLFSSEPFTPMTITSVFRGTGTSGFVFRLDAEQAARANQYFSNPDNRIGLAASASGAEGGSETFYIADAAAIAPAAADVSVVKNDSPDPVVAGESLTYEVVVNNAGPNIATNVTLVDTLPASVTFTSATATSGSCTRSGRTVVCDIGTLAAGSSATVTIVVVPTTTGTIVNNATATADQADANPANNNASEETEVVGAAPARADISVVKTDSPDPVAVGNAVTYTIQVANAGPDAATGVTLTDTLPASVTYGSASTTQGTCSPPAGRVVTCDLGNIASGATVTVTINVTANSEGVITNTATATAEESDPVPGNNTDSEQTTVGAGAAVSADLTLSKTDAPDPVVVGETLTYQLTVVNNGPDAATGVTITDTLPSSVTFVSASTPSGTCTQSGRTVTCDVGTLTTGATATATIAVTPTVAATITNVASVGANEPDPNAANNDATEQTQVVAAPPPRADLSVTKTDSVDPATVGVAFTYNITVSNAGPDAATGVTIVDTLPASVTFNSASSSPGGDCTLSGRVVTCTVGSLASGATATATISVTPTVNGTIMNTVAVSADQSDPDPTDNQDSESTQIGPVAAAGADLSITKTDSPDPLQVGQTLTYTLRVTNNGPNTATAVQVSDTLPAGVTFVDATASPSGTCTRGGSVVTCTLGTLPVSATSTISIRVTTTAVGTLTNVATVSGNEPDSVTGNNQATSTTTVIAAAAAAEIPTLNEIALGILALLLAGVAVTMIRP